MANLFQHHYPERIHRILIVKGLCILLTTAIKHPPPIAPRIFPVLYNVVKRFIDENTKSKIVVLGGELWSPCLPSCDEREKSCDQCMKSCDQCSILQQTGRRRYFSISVLTSFPKRMVEPGVSLIPCVQTL